MNLGKQPNHQDRSTESRTTSKTTHPAKSNVCFEKSLSLAVESSTVSQNGCLNTHQNTTVRTDPGNRNGLCFKLRRTEKLEPVHEEHLSGRRKAQR